MRVLVTGAGGFIGAQVLALLHRQGRVGGRRIGVLAAADQRLGTLPAGVVALEGDLGSADVLARIAALSPDVCFHLAAVPGGAAEADPALSRRVNLDTTLDLFDALAAAGTGTGTGTGSVLPVVVYASTIAVYGSALPEVVTPHTPLRPPLVYGAHKLACEVLLADFSRRGRLDGRSLRLPGIVARPRAPSGLVSAFMSELLHALAAGESVTLPVGPGATAWWMSARRCAWNLVHAASMPVGDDPGRAWPLPVLRLSMDDIVQALSAEFGVEGRALVRHAPQPAVEAVFGRYPPLDDQAPRAMGLRDDGDARALVRRALAVHDTCRGDDF